MNWIGAKEAKAAAKKGKKAALDCSIEHWRQIYRRPKSIKEAINGDKVSISASNCSLCEYYTFDEASLQDCEKCPAYYPKSCSSSPCCGGLYFKTHSKRVGTSDFTKAAKKVHLFLKGLKS